MDHLVINLTFRFSFLPVVQVVNRHLLRNFGNVIHSRAVNAGYTTLTYDISHRVLHVLQFPRSRASGHLNK